MGSCCSSVVLPDGEFFRSSEKLKVYLNEKSDIIYEPLQNIKRTGVIIYPGATADPKGYAHIAFSLAQNGYFSVLAKMPCNLAAYAPNRAADIAERYASVEQWLVGGHSLGGLMSTQFIYNNYRSKNANKKFVGLFHWGSRGYYKHDISNLSNIQTLVLYADLDGLIKKEVVEESLKYLPKERTTVRLLEGGNHSYFGDFPVGRFCCLRDNEAAVSRDEQFRFTINEMLLFLNKF